MPQLSLYIDKETLDKIQKASEIENTSISRWVTGKLREILAQDWPENYESLFGSITDDTFTEETIKCETAPDVEREKL